MININKEDRGDLASSLMTVREVAELLHIHCSTARRWADNGTLKAYRISPRGDRRFKKADVLQVISEMTNNKGFLE
jgi:excisionase family DNA binding protein